MVKQIRWQKSAVSLFLIWLMLVGSLPMKAQDLIQVSDITGGSSVFVFHARKSAPRNFTSQRVKRTVVQRAVTVKKVTRQYTVIAKTAPKRIRVKDVDPTKIPANANSLPPAKGAVVFAGVGEYYINQEDAENALKFFRAAAELDPKNKNAQNGLSDALTLKGNQLLVAEKPDAARAFFDEAVKINPDNGGAYYGLGEVLDELDKPDEAIGSYEKALSFNKDLTAIYVPLGILYYQKGEIAKADQLLSKADLGAPNDPETEYYVGAIRYTQNRNDEALKSLQKAVAADPSNAQAHYFLGKTLLRLNRQAEALTELKQAIRLKPDYFEADFDAGLVSFETANYPESISAYKEAARLKNTDAQTYANLGDAYRLNKDYNNAEGSYDLALNFIQRDKGTFTDDDIAAIHSNVAYVLGSQCEINQRTNRACKWDKAITNLEQSVAISPNASDYANLGWAYLSASRLDKYAGRKAEATAKLEKSRDASRKSAEMNPAFIEAPLVNLGTVLIDLADYKGAIDALKRVTEKRKDWKFAYYALGVAYRKSDDYKNAAEQFKSAVGLDQTYVPALAGLAESQFRSGDKKAAQQTIQKLKPLNANEAKKLEALMIGSK